MPYRRQFRRGTTSIGQNSVVVTDRAGQRWRGGGVAVAALALGPSRVCGGHPRPVGRGRPVVTLRVTTFAETSGRSGDTLAPRRALLVRQRRGSGCVPG